MLHTPFGFDELDQSRAALYVAAVICLRPRADKDRQQDSLKKANHGFHFHSPTGLSGRKWSSHTSTEQMHRIHTEMLRGGTYYVKIQDGNDATISKFVISE